MREATRRTVECVARAGDEITYGETTDWSGFVMPYYAVKEGSRSLEPCETAESFWVSYVYQLQPARYRAADTALEGHVDQLRECIEAAGYDTTGMTGHDLGEIADAIAHNSADAPDCLTSAGVDAPRG